MEIKYRYSTLEDLKSIMELLFSESSDDRNVAKDNFLLGIDNRKIVACIRIKTLDKNVFELSSLVVKQGYRKQKIGRRIVSELLKKDLRRPIYLITKIELENFYKLNNFKTINPEDLPKLLYDEFNRVINLPFAKDLKVIAMAIY
ncbi:GNAT family N-acetyltransferase [bacterium]|nr:GNAT family N-acetyltransferase [bacterium]